MRAIWLGKPAVAQMKPASEFESGQMSRGAAPMYRAVQNSDAFISYGQKKSAKRNLIKLRTYRDSARREQGFGRFGGAIDRQRG
jgi:hypothetical protein